MDFLKEYNVAQSKNEAKLRNSNLVMVYEESIKLWSYIADEKLLEAVFFVLDMLR